MLGIIPVSTPTNLSVSQLEEIYRICLLLRETSIHEVSNCAEHAHTIINHTPYMTVTMDRKISHLYNNNFYHKYDLGFGILFCKIILIECLRLVTCHSTIVYKKSLNLNKSSPWIPNLLDFLDIMAEWQVSENKHLICIKNIFNESVCLQQLGHERLHFKPHSHIQILYL